MLNIERAGCDQLPYLGFIQVRVASTGWETVVLFFCYLCFPIQNIIKWFRYYME